MFSVRWDVGGAGAAVAIAVVLVLSGCVPGEVVGPSAQPSMSQNAPVSPSAPEPSAAPSAEPSPSPTPDDSPVPVTIACSAVISAQGMYDFNPNFSLLEDFTPRSNSAAARAEALEGVACRWINQTSRATVDVSIARPGAVTLQHLREQASSGAPVADLGEFASFSRVGDAGVVEVFAGGLWLTATSVYFGSGEDARDLLVEALAAVE